MAKYIKILNDYRFLIIALLLLFTATAIERNIGILDARKINVSHFQSVLDKKYKEVSLHLEEMSSLIENNGIDAFIKKYSDEYFELFQKEGTVFLGYYNQDLKFWNSNIVTLNLEENITPDNQRLINPGNGWYVIVNNQPDDTVNLFALIPVKNDYVFENEFLVNNFHPDFKLHPEVELEFFPDAGNVITDPDGNFLFSLIEPHPPSYHWQFSLVAVSLYSLALLFFLIFLFKSFSFLATDKKNLWFGAVIIILLLVRYFMLEADVPRIFKSYSLFQPQHYAKSSLFPSLGDFLINSAFILFATACFSAHFRLPTRIINSPGSVRVLTVVFLNLILVGFMFFFHNMFSGLIFNSNIQLEVYNFVHLNQFSLIAYLILAMLLASLVLLADKIVSISSTLLGLRSFISLFLLSFAAGILTYIAFENPISVYAILFFILITGTIAGIRYFRYRYSYSFQVFLVFLISMFTLAFITKKSREKEKNIMQVIAVNLANERDQVAEFLMHEIQDNLLSDKVIHYMLQSHLHDDYDLYNYLRSNHFSGYFRKYDLQVASCHDLTDLHLADVDELVDCYSFFYDMAEEFGIPVSPGSGFYFLDNLIGRISYLGIIVYELEQYPYEKRIFISLDSKIMDTQLGFPELLIEGTFIRNQIINDYSYAKYINDRLITRSGYYSYPLVMENDRESDVVIDFFEKEGYKHLAYQVDHENLIILSKPKFTTFNLITSFSYSFVFFYLLYSLGLLVCKYPLDIRRWRIDFKNKIKISMIGVLLLSLIIIGVGTIYYTIRQFEDQQYENISEKIQSVLIDMEYNLGMERQLDPEIRDDITGMLIQLSNIFYTDINLYDPDGFLYASSRPEVFELNLIGEQMNPQAYSAMLFNNSVRFVHRESIGNLSYLSAYVPLINAENELLSYINLPYFTRQSILQMEIYTLVVAVVNIYAILILITVFIAVVVSNTITKPLRLIQNKLRKLSIGRSNEQIDYEGDDEIGNLIREYNRMVGELENSAELLARSERESAWREMAKQIAHEIKNPLTPMKLSIQHLQRSWEDKVDNWDEIFKKTTRNLIEQIDHLSSIASAFSDFARMPRPTTSNANIVSAITNVAGLFSNNENIEIFVNVNGIENVPVAADKIQLNRIFINLLKNSVQSIPPERKGKITIDLIREKEMVLVKIYDNGTGVPEEIRKKMFTPYFTTKSGGTGLGLAIVKSIVEQNGGSVGFTSQYGKGSCFFFRIPYAGIQSAN